jgi:hypothetical protein
MKYRANYSFRYIIKSLEYLGYVFREYRFVSRISTDVYMSLSLYAAFLHGYSFL